MKRIYLIATIFTVLIIIVAVVASVMLMKPISDEPEGGDDLTPPGLDDTTGPDDTDDTTTDSPLISGFDFELETGTYWNYYWTSEYNEAVQGSSGIHSVTYGDFIITLGEAILIDGITAYKTEIDGDTRCHDFNYTLRWTHLAVSGNKILGSDDNGASLKTIFDAKTGVWQGGGFFLDFPDDLHVQPSQTRIENEYINTSALCVSVSRSEGGNYYDPVTGITIYSSDERWSTDGKEFYKGGLGLVGYYYYYGWSDSGGGFFSSFSWKRELGLVDSSLTASDGFVLESTSWVRKADMPTPRYNHGASVVNGIIYVFGGMDSDRQPLDSVEAYDPATDTWTTKNSMPVSCSIANSVTINGLIYVYGGENGIMVYDPLTDAWSTHTGLLESSSYTPWWYFRESTVFSDRYMVLVHALRHTKIGGGNFYTGYLRIYDLELELGSVLLLQETEINYVLEGPAIIADSTYVYLFDGFWNLRFNPLSRESTWEEIAHEGHGYDLAAVKVDGLVYAIGGRNDEDRPFREVMAYDPELDEWIEKSSMAKPRYDLTASVVNGKIYAIGGYGNNKALSVVEEYDPSLD